MHQAKLVTVVSAIAGSPSIAVDEQKQEWDANTLSIPYYITPPLPACIVYDCREGHGVIIGNTQSVSIPFLFLFFFHQSSLYPIKIFAKCFYLLV